MEVVSSLMERSLLKLSSDHKSVVSMNLFVALLCACIVIGHLLEENRWMNESITALIIVSLLYYICGLSVHNFFNLNMDGRVCVLEL